MENVTVLKDGSSDSEDDVTVVRPKTSNRRRGLAARLNAAKKENNDSTSTVTEKASVYSMKVSKSLSSFCQGKLPLVNVIKRSNEEDVIGDSPTKKGKPLLPPSVVDCDTTVEDNDDDYISCTPENAVSITSVVKSPSPPPPPPPTEVDSDTWERYLRPRQPKMNRRAKKAYMNLTAARDTLMVDNFKDFIESETLEPDVVCLEDDKSDLLTIRVKYGPKLHRFKLNRNDMFEQVLREMGKKEGIASNKILLMHNDETIHRTDTPNSLNLQVADIIECHITSKDDHTLDDSYIDELNSLSIYIQGKNSKHKQEYKCDKLKPLGILLRHYALKNNLEPSKMRLQFDGEDISPSDTPEDLDLEDGFCLDVIVSS